MYKISHVQARHWHKCHIMYFHVIITVLDIITVYMIGQTLERTFGSIKRDSVYHPTRVTLFWFESTLDINYGCEKITD